MTMSECDARLLGALAEARLEHAELAVLLDFYYDLYETQLRAKAGLPEPEIRDELAMRWRLEGGIPQLTFSQLRIESGPFTDLVGRIIDVFLKHNPSWELQRENLSPDKLLALAQHVFETWESLTSPKPDQAADGPTDPDRMASMAVSFALAPHLQRAAEAILPQLSVDHWKRGYCPICGGVPNFSLLAEVTGARKLMCSRCAALWDYARLGCPFCGTTEAQPYYGSEAGLHRLYVCSECDRYLKAVDLRQADREVHPVVERLITVGMDLAAQQEGYGG